MNKQSLRSPASPVGLRGFTLVELVVTLGVFGVIMIVGSNFLIQTIKNANQSSIQNEVRQNASVILQDIIAQARQAYCIYYESPSPSAPQIPNNAIIRISDDPNGDKCASGNRVEYYQNQNGVVTRVATDSGNTPPPSVALTLTSIKTAVLDCSSGSLACGQTVATDCVAGLVGSSNGDVVTNGASATISIRAQQIPGQSRSDYCANVTLSDTITPRIK